MAQTQGATPQQVRKKWDALLNVINGAPAGQGEGNQGHAKSARSLLEMSDQHGGSLGPPPASPGAVRKSRRPPDWNNRHHLIFDNGGLQKNVRSYFDRSRDTDADGLRYDAPLQNEWQLDYGTDRTPRGKAADAGALPAISEGGTARKMSRSASAPSWDDRHQILFNKDNHHYHPNFRDYFNRPRELLY
jgi:hypothetical protein